MHDVSVFITRSEASPLRGRFLHCSLLLRPRRNCCAWPDQRGGGQDGGRPGIDGAPSSVLQDKGCWGQYRRNQLTGLLSPAAQHKETRWWPFTFSPRQLHDCSSANPFQQLRQSGPVCIGERRHPIYQVFRVCTGLCSARKGVPSQAIVYNVLAWIGSSPTRRVFRWEVARLRTGQAGRIPAPGLGSVVDLRRRLPERDPQRGRGASFWSRDVGPRRETCPPSSGPAAVFRHTPCRTSSARSLGATLSISLSALATQGYWKVRRVLRHRGLTVQ
jgi:hypothetical protein